MILVPQIYLKNGQAVRLENTTMGLFNEDAFAMASTMAEAGTEALYIADLNVSAVGSNENVPIIQKMKKDLGLKIMVTGAFRSPPTFDPYVNLGVELIVLDTHAYQQPQIVTEACKKYKDHIAVHIDVRGDRVTIPGWTVAANKTAYDYAERFIDQGITTIMYSNMAADGSTSDRHFEEILAFCKKTKMRIFCTNEITGLSEIERLVTLGAPRLEGLILGRGLYQGRIDLRGANAYVADMMLDSNNEPTLADM